MNKKKVLSLLSVLAALILVIGGFFLTGERGYLWVTVCVATLSCVPFFLSFEKKEIGARKIAVLTVMIVLSVFGRIAFSYLPHFKPVTAIVILAGIYLGAESGFLCGSLSALLSNFMFGQGVWTPFQMFIWGLIGFISGAFSRIFRNRFLLLAYGAFSGIAYSLFMDVLSVLWLDGSYNIARYAAYIVSSLPIMVVYAVSNVFFLFLLSAAFGKKLERIKTKYGL